MHFSFSDSPGDDWGLVGPTLSNDKSEAVMLLCVVLGLAVDWAVVFCTS
jgi:hypothetical protein